MGGLARSVVVIETARRSVSEGGLISAVGGRRLLNVNGPLKAKGTRHEKRER
jgi:hypothetical protein